MIFSDLHGVTDYRIINSYKHIMIFLRFDFISICEMISGVAKLITNKEKDSQSHTMPLTNVLPCSCKLTSEEK